MNYIKLINGFWQVRRERADFDPYVIALFFALVDIANRREWKTFTAYREDILTLSGMSTKPYYKAREILKDAKLIDYKEGSSKITKCSFTILQPLLTATQAPTVGQQFGNSSDYTRETEETTILNKLINLKQLNKSYLFFLNQRQDSKVFKIRKKDKVSFPKNLKKAAHTGGPAAAPKQQIDFGSDSFNTPEFRQKWEEFKQHRKKIKAAITTLDSEQRIFNKATAYEVEFIVEQIDAAIDSGKWQGFIFPDTPQKYKDWQSKNNPIKKLTPNRNEDEAYRVERNVA